MNYHWCGDDSFITPGQIKRMESFLRTSRANMVMGDVGGDKIPFNISVESSTNRLNSDDKCIVSSSSLQNIVAYSNSLDFDIMTGDIP